MLGIAQLSSAPVLSALPLSPQGSGGRGELRRSGVAVEGREGLLRNWDGESADRD